MAATDKEFSDLVFDVTVASALIIGALLFFNMHNRTKQLEKKIPTLEGRLEYLEDWMKLKSKRDSKQGT
jgi:chaperonin cofactor prefoldin